MSYSIFRIEGIKTTSDLRGIGKHNHDRVSRTNSDIDPNLKKENIELIPLDGKTYKERFNEITAEMKLEHEDRMKNMRKDRQKTFEQAINTARSDVACELLFTSDEHFFKDKSKEEIRSWAETSLEFLKKDIGIKEENIIEAVVHMDEKTPHLHVVAVPLVQKYDKRMKQDRLMISRSELIKTKEDMSRFQDVYHKRMTAVGYDLERGQVGSTAKHVEVLDYKEETLEKTVDVLQNVKMANAQTKLLEIETEIQQKQTEANKILQDITNRVEQLAKERKELSQQLQSKSVSEISIERIQEKSGFLKQAVDTPFLKIHEMDFNQLKRKAEHFELNDGYKKQVESLQKDNRFLEVENKQLKKENNELKIENNQLKNYYYAFIDSIEITRKKLAEKMKYGKEKFDLAFGYAVAAVSRGRRRVDLPLTDELKNSPEIQQGKKNYHHQIAEHNRNKGMEMGR